MRKSLLSSFAFLWLLSITVLARDHPPVSANAAPGGRDASHANITDAAVDTSHWKTYRNEKYGFEVKYPEGWKASFGSGTDVLMVYLKSPVRDGEPRASLLLAVQENRNPQRLSLEDWVGAQLRGMHSKPDSSGYARIGGLPAFFMEKTNSFGKNHDTFLLLGLTDVLSIHYVHAPQFDRVYETIVSSLRIVIDNHSSRCLRGSEKRPGASGLGCGCAPLTLESVGFSAGA